MALVLAMYGGAQNACRPREATSKTASAGWPGRARVVSSRFYYCQTLSTMRALHSPFDLLDPAEFLPTCARLMNAWFQIFFFLTEYYSCTADLNYM